MSNRNWLGITAVLAGLAQATLLGGLPGAGLAQVQAPAPSTTQGIYTCTDARGRKLTSDRPIPECNDREQKLLNPSGTVKAKVGPTLTAQELSEREAKERETLEEQARLNEEKRRDRALLVRYPSQATHDKERTAALAQVGVVKKAAQNRAEELMRQRTLINQEMEFYKKDPSKAPSSLRRQVDEISQSLAIQNRFITDQDSELNRVNARFDEEQVRLKQLWLKQASTVPAAAGRTR
jgi:hypothetical protein